MDRGQSSVLELTGLRRPGGAPEQSQNDLATGRGGIHSAVLRPEKRPERSAAR
jgi:hypothetical protein